MDIQSIIWLSIAVISFIAAISVDSELRKEMTIRNIAGMIFSLVVVYFAIMYVAKEWITWCL